ncbi:MAG: BatD family protein [Candidatus Sumerlaeaceae bacterium]|nr:BatD family protein [Candidatus Sumerlaeaceae bacterium]
MRRCLNFCIYLMAMGWVTTAALIFAQPDCRVTATISPQNPLVGEPIVYVLRVECTRAEEQPQVQPPDVLPDSGLTEMKPVGTKREINIVNGRQSQAYEFRYTFQAIKAGEYQLPAATVAVDGTIFESNAVTLRVSSSPQVPQEGVPAELRGHVVPPRIPSAPHLEQALTGKVFILALAETTQPLSGQQFLLSYHLFIDQQGLEKAGLDSRRFSGSEPELPPLKDFLKEEIYAPPQQLRFEQQTIGGRRYAVAPLYQVAITPTRSGNITIESAQLSLVFPIRSRTRRMPTGDPFVDLFDFDPFNTQGLQIVVRSAPLELAVSPLPESGKPTVFCGAVGQFVLEASVDKTHLLANEDVGRLRLVLRGEGNAGTAAAPPFPQVEGLSLLEEPKANFERKIENNKLITIKTFDYLFRATKQGNLKIPPIEIAVFNPVKRNYETLRTQEIPLVVAPGTASPVLTAQLTTQPAVTPVASPPEIRTDLRYIHEGRLRGTTQAEMRKARIIQLGIVGTSAGIFLLSLMVSGLRKARSRDDALQRSAKVYHTINTLLHSLAKRTSTHATDECQKLGHALREYFAAIFETDANALTNEEIYDKLSAAGIDDEVLRRLQRILELVESVRYAPSSTDIQNIQNAAPEIRQILEEIQRCVRK